VLVGGGSAALAATGEDPAQPVTATAVTGSVTQVVEASGTVGSSSQASASFATNGTVSTVKVKAGQQVSKGQVLAKLDTSSLDSDVDSAGATVATAKQKLAADKAGQTSAAGSGIGTASGTPSGTADSLAATDSAFQTLLPSPSSPGTGTNGTGTSGTGKNGSPGGSTLSRLLAQIAAGQQQVLAAQQAVDAGQQDVDATQQVVDQDVVQNTKLRDAQKSTCAGGSSDPACTSAQADYEAFADTLSTDMAALDKAVTAQDGKISSLDGAVKALDGLLSMLPAAIEAASNGTGLTGSPGSSGTGSSGTGSSGTGSSGTGSSGTGGTTRQSGSPQNSQTGGSAPQQSSSEPASASRLAADQASIDAAEAQLKLARQNLRAATLTSPISGTVATVGFTVGSGSNGQSITILGTGNQIVQINVPLSQIEQVKLGQSASLAVDGQTSALHGTVTKIGLLSSTSAGTTTFPVTVTLAANSPKLFDGVGADATVTTGTVSNAVTVPNSAITTVGSRHLVTVVRGGRSTTTQVTLGLAGAATSQVTAGVKAGDKVQLALPGKALPSSATSNSTSIRRFGGTFPGGFTGRLATFGGGG
jgi:HlyD family secretion protein